MIARNVLASLSLSVMVVGCKFPEIPALEDDASAPDGDTDAVPAVVTLSIVKAGAGSGVVTSMPQAVDCGTTCSAGFAIGASVELIATADVGHTFVGWSGGGCSSTGACTVLLSADTTVVAEFQRSNLVFVTSTTVTGNLGGLAGADAMCTARAAAAGLPGTYRAWLSTSTVNAADRLGNASGWVRPDGRPFAATRASLLAGAILYPPLLDETSAAVEHRVRTGTGPDGRSLAGGNCVDWTSALVESRGTGGGPSFGTVYWTGNGEASSCNIPNGLYCLGIDQVRPLTVQPPAQFRRAFLTAALWTAGGGLTSADALCQSEAQAASLPGTYLAALPPTTARTTMSRFDTSGPPWVRVDHVVLASTAAAFFTSAVRFAPLNVTARGQYEFITNFILDEGVRVGTTSMDVTPAADGVDTCSDWTSTSNSLANRTRRFDDASPNHQFPSPRVCSVATRLYCLQM